MYNTLNRLISRKGKSQKYHTNILTHRKIIIQFNKIVCCQTMTNNLIIPRDIFNENYLSFCKQLLYICTLFLRSYHIVIITYYECFQTFIPLFQGLLNISMYIVCV